MATVYEVPAGKLIKEAARDLKENVKFNKPAWTEYVKTGAQVERIPEDPDWWYARSASILRKIYVNGPVGVRRLRTAYGGRENKGVKPQHFRKAGGKIIRVIMKQFDEIGFTEKVTGGRKISAKGVSFLDKAANAVSKT
jgi:small subunit ribosomal protein S19e